MTRVISCSQVKQSYKRVSAEPLKPKPKNNNPKTNKQQQYKIKIKKTKNASQDTVRKETTLNPAYITFAKKQMFQDENERHELNAYTQDLDKKGGQKRKKKKKKRKKQTPKRNLTAVHTTLNTQIAVASISSKVDCF